MEVDIRTCDVPQMLGWIQVWGDAGPGNSINCVCTGPTGGRWAPQGHPQWSQTHACGRLMLLLFLLPQRGRLWS